MAAERWMSPEMRTAMIYGSISTLIVSLLSLSGAVVIPLLTGKAKHRWMHFFVAMSIATLSSDAILHIIPQIMDVHGHSHHDHSTAPTANVSESTAPTPHGHGLHYADHHDHHHDPDEDHSHSVQKRHAGHHLDNVHGGLHWLEVTHERKLLLRLSAVIVTIYLIYFFEFVLYYRKHHKCSGKQKSSIVPQEARIIQCTETVTNHAWEEEHTCGVTSSETLVSSDRHSSTPSGEADDDIYVCWQFKSRALVILLGDGVHNFIDGIAIGTSFMSSTKLGIITSIAVICHELPHELGDFAVLIESGLSTATALGFNLLSALTAFLGLFVSISLGEFKEVQTWLLAITAGMFLYVAWIDMLSHLKHDGSHVDHWTFACFLQYSGFCVGFVLILALGWFEDELFSS